ncbi:hypothetical protein Pen01_09040 [Phytomonospora endophytica]|nr:hypothetical protein Pen01_09040 [Phytomonospora endophytica]
MSVDGGQVEDFERLVADVELGFGAEAVEAGHWYSLEWLFGDRGQVCRRGWCGGAVRVGSPPPYYKPYVRLAMVSVLYAARMETP